MRKQSFNKPFMVAVVALGAAACVYSAARFPAELLDWRFLLVALVTVCFGSRIGIEVSRVKCQITVSDTFVFLIMLLYGAEAAVLVAAAEAFVSSFRFSRLWLTRFFNGALLACSTFVTAWVVASCFGPVTSLSSGRLNATFVTAVIMMASAQYLCNTSLAAFRESLKIGEPFLATWSNYYLWISITYFGGASAAAITAELIELSGFYAFAVTAPLITVIYFTYRTYRKHIQVTEAQAEQAERHVEELNLHLAEQERIRQALQQSEEHYRNAFEHFRSSFEYAAIGMALLAPDGRWLQVNHSLCKIVGYSEEELLASKWQDITHPDDLGRHLKEMYELVEGKVVTSSSELRYVHREGHDVWAMASASLVRDAQQKPLHVILQLQDITERKRAEGQLHHAAYHDALTGLPNRALFTEHLRVALRRSAEGAENLFAVLFLDLDRFKNINDSLGHVQGDQLLIAVSRRLKQCVRPGDMVARFGGDEFAVLLSSLDCPSDATDIAERVQTAIRSPVHLGGHEVRTAASIGIALSTSGYAQPNDVLRDADTAMYHAKEQGHGHYQVFDRLMHAHVTSLLQRENDLRRAVERAELTLHYQPIVKLATGEITGFEALVRWVHPERGLVPPSDFIPLAEEMGLILPIGWWVLREACEQMRRWQESFHPPEGFDVSVNISAKQFSQPDMLERVERVLRETGLDPRRLTLEITESVIMSNADLAAGTLRQLRALGVQLSIDDFGTGYSSLSYLHGFPANTLKIDRSFVSKMTGGNESAAIVETIITLASKLRMNVVAEGLETAEQKAQLLELGCEHGQGYLFSKPVDARAADRLLQEKAQWLAAPAPTTFGTHDGAELLM